MSGAESRSRAPEGSDAGSTEEQSVHAIEDEPAIRLDGHLHRLKPGDGVGFRAGTGIAHGFLNNTQRDVRLPVVGEHEHADNRFTLFLAELRDSRS